MSAYRNMNGQNGRGSCNCNQNYGYNEQRRTLYDDTGRSMEIECVCSAKEKKCDKKDAMKKLGDAFPVVMAYVPWQQWGDLYNPDRALKEGTLFKDLNKIFCGMRC